LHGRLTIRDRLQAARAEGRMLLGGHRGNPADFPENTIPSYESAIAAGCDLIECDVHLTADGRLAVIHDHLVDRTTDGQGLVGGMTMAEL
jgi:glycerophosphoryl diester phosphodiesterase